MENRTDDGKNMALPDEQTTAPPAPRPRTGPVFAAPPPAAPWCREVRHRSALETGPAVVLGTPPPSVPAVAGLPVGPARRLSGGTAKRP
ncbi:hypothetical protein LUX12_01205 [Streptomyces somaliensis]|uniref:hypothetical protein n=1 Tax=Streptomyces somaliensis TaxID=78355 RepID=UPI0020CDDBC5|nr:hypothetical protein [Streptomyces somaliensis]MCP9943736.1 hypothetical protein [Streptomyces somaliensis]